MDDHSAQTIGDIIAAADLDARDRLLEHEVYRIVRLIGAAEPPAHVFVRAGESIAPDSLARLTTPRVVLKIVSPAVVHKSDAHGVVFCANDPETITHEIERLTTFHEEHHLVHGVLIVECVEADSRAELFVGVRATREFGPVIAAGIGGVETEYMASVMRPGRAVATALASDLNPGDFLDLFKRTAAYDLLAGRVRGRERAVSDEQLLTCFGAFIEFAQTFCVHREGPAVTELEVNPFACRGGRLVPLDGRARLGRAPRAPAPRPVENVRRMLGAKSIAVLGVSATKRDSFGRIILNSVLAAGFDPRSVRVVKDGCDVIDGVACVRTISELESPVDLLVVAAGAAQLPGVVDECVDSGKVSSAILIPGGAGETEGTEGIARDLRAAIARARAKPDGPVFLGPNSLGMQSRPGRYDTFFIPASKLDMRWGEPHRGVALVSQSGAFILRELCNFEALDPALTVSIGNQSDLTLSDVVRAVAERTDVHTIGVYAEGFNDLDGLELFRAIRSATEAGKAVVFYKAGRTPAGRDAAAGHTASLAGDYAVCEAGAAQAGALVTTDFAGFGQQLAVAAMTHGSRVGGTRIGAISNAGCETVAMADNTGDGLATLPALNEATREQLKEVMATHGLGGLVNPRNPLDLTPMAGDAAYLDAARVLLGAEEIDALVMSCFPLSPYLASVGEELAHGSPLADGLAALRDEFGKPIVVVVDAGPRYDPYVSLLHRAGFAVVRSSDEAVRVLGRVLAHRLAHRLAHGAAHPGPAERGGGQAPGELAGRAASVAAG